MPIDPWPESDDALMDLLRSAPDPLLHELMCACAEHACAACEPLYQGAGYTWMPDLAPIDVKRRWLAGEASDDELSAAQGAGVRECYWGNPLRLGAAILGCAWQPGSGLALAEDEEYAESMTWFKTALEAACGVMSQAEQAVGDLTYRSLWKRDDDAPAQAASLAAREAERAWQRAHAIALLAG